MKNYSKYVFGGLISDNHVKFQVFFNEGVSSILLEFVTMSRGKLPISMS
jgi:hypothetical protein